MTSFCASVFAPLFLFSLVTVRTVFAHGKRSCGEAANCCACVRTPGCSWFYSTNLTQPYCSSIHSMPSSGGIPDEALETRIPYSPSVELFVRRAEPINFSRRRLITPQSVFTKANVGLSKYVFLRVMSRSRTVRLRVVGPWDGIEFNLYTARQDMCHPGLRRTGSSRSAAQRSRGNRRRQNRPQRERPERLGIQCVTTAPGDVSHFKLLVTVTSCFSGSKVIRVIPRSPGQRSVPLRVRIKAKCECPCESNATDDGTSTPGPTSAGTDDDDDDDDGDDDDDDESCMQSCAVPETGEEAFECLRPLVPELCGSSAEPERTICSNQGTCVCGECLCNSVSGVQGSSVRYSGRVCECNDHGCPLSSNGQMCGGPLRGRCTCGQCQCRPGWQGQSCDCAEDLNLCPRASNGDVCGGVGTCVCGQCHCPGGYLEPACDTGGSTSPDGPCSGRGLLVNGVCVCREPYAGDQCQECPRCVDVRCEQHRQCVACRVFPFLAQGAGCASCQSDTTVVQQDHVVFQPHPTLGDAENLCVYWERTCTFEFYYQIHPNRTTVIHYNSYVRTLEGTNIENPTLADCTMPPPVSSSSGGGL